MKATVVMAPVDWRLAAPEIVFIVADCKAGVLFVGSECAQIRAITSRLPELRTIIATEGGAPNGTTTARGATSRARTT